MKHLHPTRRLSARSLLLLAALFALTVAGARAQARPDAPEDLARTLAAQDAALFDAYNRCDLDKFAAFFDENVEFYHDKGGVTHGRAAVVENTKKYICGKVRRELVAGSLEAHPIAGFGAVEMGSHRFYELGAKPGSGPTGVAKFVLLWRHKDGAWQVTRVISYDHAPAPK